MTFENYTEHNGHTFWGDVGAGILPVCIETKRILVGYRSIHVLEPNTYGVFGGKLDLDEGIDETIKEACLRELEEETRYRGEIDLVDAYVFKSGNFTYYNFFGIVPNEFEPELDWENEDAIWITLEELINLKKKHFGLEALLKNSMEILKNILK